ncbi:hypothetical protein TNCV_1203701 [Trichonephila clavipes]|nr:hypothetical protein TNCV_1203701 [Trichonephila clavipes]
MYSSHDSLVCSHGPELVSGVARVRSLVPVKTRQVERLMCTMNLLRLKALELSRSSLDEVICIVSATFYVGCNLCPKKFSVDAIFLKAILNLPQGIFHSFTYVPVMVPSSTITTGTSDTGLRPLEVLGPVDRIVVIYTAPRLRTPSTDQSTRRKSRHTSHKRRANCLIGHCPDTGSTFTTSPCVLLKHRRYLDEGHLVLRGPLRQQPMTPTH